jgi:hypothetical protein
MTGGWWVRAEALAGFVANAGIALGASRAVDATDRLPYYGNRSVALCGKRCS